MDVVVLSISEREPATVVMGLVRDDVEKEDEENGDAPG